MDDFSAMLRRERAIRALWPLFFVSGATSLAYQTLWARQLHLVFGTSTMAIATVLTAFMGGLALGGALMARRADRVQRPLRVYAMLEAGVGLYAVAFPGVLALLEPVYLAFYRGVEPPVWLFALAQLALVGVALVLPTALMGATLPLLARFATERLGDAGDRVGSLYGVNTLGAVFGTWACGFWLLPTYGLWATTLGAGLANLVLAGLAALVDSESGASEVAEVTPPPPLRGPLLAVAAALALAGFASLVDEVAWFRLLTLMLGPSAYAFSLMLLAFLVGIGLGGLAGGRVADAIHARRGVAGVLVALAVIEVGVALTTFAAMYGFQLLPYGYVLLWDALGADGRVGRVWALSLVLAGLTMTPPAVLMGAAFPMAARAVMVDERALGNVVGRIYAANTLGAVLGASLAGFVLLPGLGVQGTILTAALANVAAALVLVLVRTAAVRGRWRFALVGAVVPLAFVVARPPWDKLLMTAGMYHYADNFNDHSWAGFHQYSVDAYELLYYREGLTSVVTVAKNRRTEQLWLANNGKIDASSAADMPTQVLCALLPFQFVDEPKDVLVIGLASGVTAGALQPVHDIKRLDIVEIEPAITEAARYFDEWNHDVLDDPRTHLIANDGRNHVLLTAPGTYDVVVSEPSNPWITGVSNLFTREFFELGRSRLAPGGVWSQWVQLYGMDEADVASLLGTFADVFPYVLIYSTIDDADLVLVGSDQMLRPDPAAGARLLARWPAILPDLDQVGVNDPMDLVALFAFDQDEIKRLARGVALNTDDNMRIEYAAPLHLNDDTAEANMLLLESHSQLPFDTLQAADAWLELALRYRESKQIRRSNLALVEAARRCEAGSDVCARVGELVTRWQTEAL